LWRRKQRDGSDYDGREDENNKAFWQRRGCRIVNIMSMVWHANCTCYYIQSNFLLTTILIVLWSGSDVLSILHPNTIVCNSYIGVLLRFRKLFGGFWVDAVTHYNFSHLK
jgi:hypothetical protein